MTIMAEKVANQIINIVINKHSNNATISFNGDTGTGFEMVNGRVDYNRPIYNIRGFDLTEGTYTGVTWTSRDGSSPEYHHVGRLIITDIDPSRPNHS
mgnify:CR=1 FL=1